MGNVRFISDTHFGHKNMALKRGFSSAEEMNEHIVVKWNSVVNKKDVTYLLGDVTMESKNFYHILTRLNGVINVVLGNHCRRQDIPELLKYVNSVAGMIDYKNNCILTHCPIHPSQLDFRYSYNVHGHVHENSIDDERYINVSCEVVDYTPKLLTELIK